MVDGDFQTIKYGFYVVFLIFDKIAIQRQVKLRRNLSSCGLAGCELEYQSWNHIKTPD